MREKRALACWAHLWSRRGLSLFFFGICEQLDVFDICVTGHHCSSRLAQKLRCPDHLSLCVCVCVCVRAWDCVCTSEQPSIATGEKKKNTHKSTALFLNTHHFCHEIHFDTNNECVSSCQFISVSSFYASTLPHSHPFPLHYSFLLFVSLRPLSQDCPWIVHAILFSRFLFDSLPFYCFGLYNNNNNNLLHLFSAFLGTQSALHRREGILLNHHQCAASTWMMQWQPYCARTPTTHQLTGGEETEWWSQSVYGDD